jgi:hypothetical protein
VDEKEETVEYDEDESGVVETAMDTFGAEPPELKDSAIPKEAAATTMAAIAISNPTRLIPLNLPVQVPLLLFGSTQV